jgi:hypothetical protein
VEIPGAAIDRPRGDETGNFNKRPVFLIVVFARFHNHCLILFAMQNQHPEEVEQECQQTYFLIGKPFEICDCRTTSDVANKNR